MKLNKIKLLLPLTLLLFSLTGCEEDTIVVNVNVENSEQLSNIILGKDAFINIGSDLYYDSTTRIVYIKYENVYGDMCSAYYAPNGLPYRYNPETNTFEEIGEK